MLIIGKLGFPLDKEHCTQINVYLTFEGINTSRFSRHLDTSPDFGFWIVCFQIFTLAQSDTKKVHAQN